MTRRMTAVPLLKRRKLARNSSVGSAEAPEAVLLRSKAENRAVGRRMLKTLSGCVGLSAAGTRGVVTHPTVRRELLSCVR